MYSAAAGSLLALGTPASGQIEYSGLMNDVYPPSDEPYLLDVNNDGMIDFGIMNYVMSSSYSSMGYQVTARFGMRILFNLATATYNSFLAEPGTAGTYSLLRAMGSDESIDSLATNWSTNAFPAGIINYFEKYYVANSTTSYSTGMSYTKFPKDEQSFAGINFAALSGRHFGWLRLTVNSDQSITFHDWAYHTEAGEGLLTGLVQAEFSNEEFYSNLNVEIGISFSETIDNIAPEDFVVEGGSVSSISTVTAGEQYNVAISADEEGIITVELPSGAISHDEKAVSGAITQFVVHNVLDVEEVSSGIKFYPNPASDFVHLDLNHSSDVYIMSTTGKVLMEKRGITSGQIDVSHLSKGLYILQIKNKELGSKSFKILKN